jgi:Domain of unknown function (DUF4412)
MTPIRQLPAFRPWWAWSAALLGALITSPILADDVLEIARHTEVWKADGALFNTAEEQGTIYLGKERARFDQGKVSWILRADQQRMWLLDHDTKSYQEFAIPMQLEAYLKPEERAQFEQLSTWAMTEIEVKEIGEAQSIEGWPSTKVAMSVRSPGSSTGYTYDLWLSDRLPIDLHLFQSLLRNIGAVDVTHRAVADRMAQLAGFPVVRDSVIELEQGHRAIDRRRLVSLVEREVPETQYTPPPEYQAVPFSFSQWLEMK